MQNIEIFTSEFNSKHKTNILFLPDKYIEYATEHKYFIGETPKFFNENKKLVLIYHGSTGHLRYNYDDETYSIFIVDVNKLFNNKLIPLDEYITLRTILEAQHNVIFTYDINNCKYLTKHSTMKMNIDNININNFSYVYSVVMNEKDRNDKIVIEHEKENIYNIKSIYKVWK